MCSRQNCTTAHSFCTCAFRPIKVLRPPPFAEPCSCKGLLLRKPVFTHTHTLVFTPSISPPARWGWLNFIRAHARPPPLPPPPPPPPRLAGLLALLLASASSTSTSALPTLPTLPTRRQALRQLPSSVRTAGRQPASWPAQCAPLDLNLGPAQLSVHRWTSTWEICQIECQIECQKICQIECQKICPIECQKICQIEGILHNVDGTFLGVKLERLIS